MTMPMSNDARRYHFSLGGRPLFPPAPRPGGRWKYGNGWKWITVPGAGRRRRDIARSEKNKTERGKKKKTPLRW